MEKVSCGSCGREFEYLVDSGFCEECLQERLKNEDNQ